MVGKKSTQTSSTAQQNKISHMAVCRVRRGFTLLELCIVAIVIVAILGIGVVQLDSALPDARLRKVARRTADLIELTATQAAIEGRPLALIFDTDLREIRIEIHLEEGEEAWDPFALEEAEEEEPIYITKWDEEVSLEELLVDDLEGSQVNSDRIIFLPEGSCDGATLKWRERSGLSQSLEVWPLLTRVDLKEVDSSQAF
jgi:type II secretory pathway pseudopilin PulG